MNMAHNEYNWFEKLPSNCPPPDAQPPANEKYYRLVNNPISDIDFVSHRQLYPEKPFRLSECIARATSLFDDPSSCKNIMKLSRYRNRKIACITLPPSSGLIMHTGQDKTHYSWWRDVSFDPVAAAIIES
jgi:hypothetical protein